MSARTALDWQSEDPGAYTHIADVIRQISRDATSDLKELWLRIVFTILVSNTDDHLKNHGFIYVGGDRWRLSPAFDINPSPDRHRKLETAIMEGGSFDADLGLALEAAQFFDLDETEARASAKKIAQTLAGQWRTSLRDEGCSAQEVNQYRDAFEHDAAEQALALE